MNLEEKIAQTKIKINEMMETITAVKGERYAEFVMMTVESSMFIKMLKTIDLSHRGQRAIAISMAGHLISKSFSQWAELNNLTDDELKAWKKDALADCDRLVNITSIVVTKDEG